MTCLASYLIIIDLKRILCPDDWKGIPYEIINIRSIITVLGWNVGTLVGEFKTQNSR